MDNNFSYSFIMTGRTSVMVKIMDKMSQRHDENIRDNIRKIAVCKPC